MTFRPLFTEVAEEVGVDFVHSNGMTGEWYFPEIMGPGVALLDYDNDGDMDLYFVQGAVLGEAEPVTQSTSAAPEHDRSLGGRLFRNDLRVGMDGVPALHFTDVTEGSGIDAHGYGMGVAVGDFNNDSWPDLYLTNFGVNKLLRNNGDGTFADAAPPNETELPSWGASAAFVDFDRDENLDLFVCNYVNFTLATHKRCFSDTSARDYCGPDAYEATTNRLLRNCGDGTFQDVSFGSRIAVEPGKSLGLVCADFNGDGWIDIYVANDGEPNTLWVNRRDGTFDNEALIAGCAVNRFGKSEASMGVDAGDFDGDGDEDLFMTHLASETNTLYVNSGEGLFEDRSVESNLAAASLPYTGFGTAWFDFDNDGWLDIATVNGEVRMPRNNAARDGSFPLHQPNQLFRNLGNSRFEDVTHFGGRAFEVSEVSRGAAFGDLDNDGDCDIVVSNCNGSARVLINESGNKQHWLGLRLVTASTSRDALGARVAVFREGHPTLWRRVRTDGSYASANDPRVLIGLNETTVIGVIRALWPDGTTEEWSGIPPKRYTTLRQGSGKVVTSE